MSTAGWRRIPMMVRVLALGQLLFALVVMAIVLIGLRTVDHAPYQQVFFSQLADAVERGTLSGEEQRAVVEVIEQFPREVNGALRLAAQADRTTLAVAACMVFLPLALFWVYWLRGGGK